MRKALRAAFVLLVLLALPAAALTPYLVKDINRTPAPESSSPGRFVTFRGAALFTAEDGLTGRELWRSDGTEAGTWLVADTCEPECSGDPEPVAVTDRLYFFRASGGPGQHVLWVTGGEPRNTFRLTDPSVVAGSSAVWVAAQGVLYFVAVDDAHGAELWRTDGTPRGTSLVTDLRPGPGGSIPRWLTQLGGKVYFSADDGRGGALWRTDGTPLGTVQIKDPVPSSVSHEGPQYLQVFGKSLVFAAPTPDSGTELWRSDGTTEGTVIAADVAPGPASTRFWDLAVQGKRLYLVAETDAAGQELWVSDGTGPGTRALTRFTAPGAFFTGSYFFPLPRTLIGGRLVFAADDGPHGAELWTTDGTVNGTRLLRDVCPGPCRGVDRVSLVHRGRLHFAGRTETLGIEPWSTDGTAAGTRLLRDACPGSCSSHPSAGVAFKERVIFLAGDVWSTDGTPKGTVRLAGSDPPVGFFLGATALPKSLLFVNADAEHGFELWRTDGTAKGSRLLMDINGTDRGGSYVAQIRAAGSSVFFFAEDGEHGFELWKSDGSAAGTALVSDLVPGEEPRFPLPGRLAADAAGGRLFFVYTLGSETALWVSDGTRAGTIKLTGPGAGPCCHPEVRALGSKVFFTAGDSAHGGELWASDGTVAGTRMVKDIAPGFSGSEPGELTAFQGRLYFSARSGSERELWRSDGTEAGTVQVMGSTGSSQLDLTVHGGRLWFFADDGEHGRELWSSDGTGPGTRLEVDLEPGPESFPARILASAGTRLFLSVSAADDGGLWVSDGTPAGTRRIDEVPVRDDPLALWTVFEDRLYYAAVVDFHEALWVSDGTEEGTGPFHDRDGREIGSPGAFAVLGDRLLVASRDDGIPLWESDGTEDGTLLLRQLSPGSTGTWELVRAGARVFFQAFGRQTGFELWAVEGDAP